MIECEGLVVRDDQVFTTYPDACSITTPALNLWPFPVWSDETLVSFTARNVVLMNYFAVADADSKYFFINQSYSAVLEAFLPPGVKLSGDQFKMKLEATKLAGRYVVIGGPVDANWWHWLFSWCPRLMLLRHLRPDLFDDPNVRFVVHPLALKGSFGATLAAFGIPVSRLLPLDLTTAHVLEEAVLVSFLDQIKIYAAPMRAFATHVRQKLGITRRAGAGRRVYASRQGQPLPRRRVKNWHETSTFLADLGFEIHSFGDLDAHEQIQIYADADVVVAVHGSDLTGLIFCQPGTKVLVFETQWNINARIHIGLEWLCKIFGLEYTRLIVEQVDSDSPEPVPQAGADQFQVVFNRDVVLDAAAFDAIRSLVA